MLSYRSALKTLQGFGKVVSGPTPARSCPAAGACLGRVPLP
jgi:hypothetical protein